MVNVGLYIKYHNLIMDMIGINIIINLILVRQWKHYDDDGDDDDDADDGGDGGDPLIGMMMIKAVLLAFSLSSNNGRWLW